MPSILERLAAASDELQQAYIAASSQGRGKLAAAACAHGDCADARHRDGERPVIAAILVGVIAIALQLWKAKP